MVEHLARVAHELRTPLGPLTNAIYIIRQNLLEPVIILEQTNMMERQVSGLKILIGDLLDSARIMTGKMRLEFSQVHVYQFLEMQLEQVRTDFERKHLTLTLQPVDSRLTIHADPFRLGQVVSNLLTNSHRYTPEGGKIDVFVYEDDGAVVIGVKDTGRGINASTISHVFDMFVQEKSSEGLGMGLWIARQIVELHGGTISVASKGLNQGTEFLVKLPQISPR